jgi:hypothetical protein
MLAIQTLAGGLVILAAVVYGVFLYQSRGAPDAAQISAIVSWVLVALVVVMVAQTMANCPAELWAIKAFYMLVVVVMVVNAIIEVSTSESLKNQKTHRSLTWVSLTLAIIVTLVASARQNCWNRTGSQLRMVQQEFRASDGDDRVATAEGVLLSSGLKPRAMKRMLAVLERSARKAQR